MIEYLGVLFVFGSILFLAYVTTRFIGNKAGKALKGKYLNIIETVSIGTDKRLHLVKVAEQYILIASSGKSIEFLTNVNLKGYQPEEPGENVEQFDFKSVLEKYVPGLKNGLKTGIDGSSDTRTPYQADRKVFSNNLSKLRNITANVKDATGKDGDEYTDEM